MKSGDLSYEEMPVSETIVERKTPDLRWGVNGKLQQLVLIHVYQSGIAISETTEWRDIPFAAR